MKKLILLTFFVLSTFVLFAQEPPYTPMKGNYKFKGVKCDSLFLVPSFSDTTAANATYLDSVPGAMIRCGNDFFMRNANTSAWLQNVNVGDGANPFAFTLQDVTDAGYVTNNIIWSGNLTINENQGGDPVLSMFYNTNDGNILLFIQDTANNGYPQFIQGYQVTDDRYYTLPDTSGYFVMSINGNLADSTGNITIPLNVLDSNITNTTQFDNLLVEKNDTIFKKQTPKVLVLGNVSQSGSSAPTFDILENTTGVPNGDISMSYVAQGQYQVIAASGTPFTSGKVGVLLSSTNANGDSVYDYDFSSSSVINFRSYNGSATSTDSLFLNATIEIKIYP